MTTREENERLTRVGPGTPGGELFRRYWMPACLTSELGQPDDPPVRVRLLGEDLIAFRDTKGRPALLDAYCPHRRAPMFYGRNEDCGLRCVYHGWKFDLNGDCVDMPSEPAGTPLQAKVKIRSFPVVDKGGIIWTYMGPRDTMPPPPDHEWIRAPATHRHVTKTFEECNYLQALEGGLDTAHSSFAHNNAIHDPKELRNADKAPTIEIERTDYGYWYASTRKVGADRKWIKYYQYIMPTMQARGGITAISGGKNDVPKIDGHIWVPIDDETCQVYNWAVGYDINAPLTPEYMEEFSAFTGRGKADHIPGTFKLVRNKSNDYLIDRKLQKEKTYTGITGLNTQDYALQEGMGPIVDRSQEFLGTSDRAIVAMRRLMLEAIDEVAHGKMPRASDSATYRNVRAHDEIIPADADWKVTLASEIVAKF